MIQRGRECYEVERLVFPRIAGRQRKYLLQTELALILKWKLGRLKKSDKDIVKRLRDINAAIRHAGLGGSETVAITTLCQIKGIKIAVASAILTLCYPKTFTIIDRRVLKQLGLKPEDANRWTATDYWQRYVPTVVKFAKKHGLSLREADQVLWGVSVYGDICDRLK